MALEYRFRYNSSRVSFAQYGTQNKKDTVHKIQNFAAKFLILLGSLLPYIPTVGANFP